MPLRFLGDEGRAQMVEKAARNTNEAGLAGAGGTRPLAFDFAWPRSTRVLIRAR